GQWITISKMPLRDEHGQIVGLIGVNHNITTVKTLQDELQRERNLLRTVIDAIPDAVYVKDRDSRFTLVNRMTWVANGFAGPEAMLGKTDLELFAHTGAAKAYFESEQQLMQTGEPIINQEVNDAYIENYPLIASILITKVPIRDEGGQIIGLVGINRDVTPVTRLQDDLRRERNLLRTLIDTIPDDVYVKDRDSRFVLVNQPALRRFGGSIEDVRGKTDMELFGAQGQRFYEQEQALMSGREKSLQFELHLPSGPYYGPDQYFMVTKVPLRDEYGNVVGLIGINYDVSALKALQNDLQRERNLLRSIIETIPDDIYVKDRDSRFILVNQATLRTQGKAHADELLGKTDLDLADSYGAEYYQQEQTLMATGAPVFNFEKAATLRHIPGREWITITKVPLRDEHGQIIGLIGTTHDITAVKRLQEDLRHERNLLRSVIDAIPDEIYVKDRQSRFILVNQSTLRIEGQQHAGDLLGKTDFDLNDTVAPVFYEQEQAIMDSGVPVVNYEMHLTRPPVPEREWVTITKVPLRDAAGQVIGLIGTNHDITSIKRLQEDLRRERNLLRSLIDTIPDEIYIKDRDARFVLVNQATLRTQGKAHADELLGKTDLDL
ncbi:MAG: PAS domain-containing protein, partial [Anaerolineae bacterium]|nr:PAS domain-containing protein [Anaerolineae bacterium]